MAFVSRLRWTSFQLVFPRMQFAQYMSLHNTARTSADVKRFEEIPGPKGIYALPLIGSIFHYKPFTNETGKTMNHLVNSLFDQYGPIFKCKLGSTLVVISDPRDIETVLQNEGKYPKRPVPDLAMVYAERNKCRLNLTQMQGEEWYTTRAPLNRRLMKADSAHYYLPIQNAVADEFVQLLFNQDLQPEEISDLFFRFAAESVGGVCFNSRLGFLDKDIENNKDDHAFLTASMNAILCLQKSVSGESVAHRYYRNKNYRIYEQQKYVIKDIIWKYINEANTVLEEQRRNGILNPDESNLLLSLMSDNSIKTEDVFNMIEALYSAGTDSTAKNLQTFLFNLATNPDKQEILREEVVRVLGNANMITPDVLANMHYLKAALKESFRLLFPIGTGTWRNLPTEVVLSGYRIPANTSISMYNLRSCIDYFPDPDKFIPERWLRSPDGKVQNDVHRCAVLPFGFGTRSCIGRRFAEQEIYLAAAKILQKLKIELEPESYNTKFIYTLFIGPEEPLKFKFTPLSTSK